MATRKNDIFNEMKKWFSMAGIKRKFYNNAL